MSALCQKRTSSWASKDWWRWLVTIHVSTFCRERVRAAPGEFTPMNRSRRTGSEAPIWSETDQKAIREQLVRILNSGPFHQSHRRQRFLEYLVNETLAGRGERLKAYNVALEVFERPETFDPAIDPLVRIEAARLREKLREYYGTEGQSDAIHINLPKGTYAPLIEFREEGAAEHPVLHMPEGPAIAVLPFVNLGGDPQQEYFSDGLTEDLMTELSRASRDLRVLARNTTFQYKGKAVDVTKLGH